MNDRSYCICRRSCGGGGGGSSICPSWLQCLSSRPVVHGSTSSYLLSHQWLQYLQYLQYLLSFMALPVSVVRGSIGCRLWLQYVPFLAPVSVVCGSSGCRLIDSSGCRSNGSSGCRSIDSSGCRVDRLQWLSIDSGPVAVDRRLQWLSFQWLQWLSIDSSGC